MPESYEEQVRKLDLKTADPQYLWYKPKRQRLMPKDGNSKPPRGVRLVRTIKSL